MLKLKLQYFGHLMQRASSLEKTDAEKDWREKEKGVAETEMVRITNSMDTNLSWLWKIAKDRGAWLPAAHGITNHQTWLSNLTPPPPPSRGFLMPWSHQEFGRKQILWDKTPSLPCTAWDGIWLSSSLNWLNYSNVLDILWTFNKLEYETHRTHHRRWTQLTSSRGVRLSAVTSPSEQVVNKSCLVMAMMIFSLFYESFLKITALYFPTLQKKMSN